MKKLQLQHRALAKLFPVQIPNPGQAVRAFDYLITAEVPEGLLVYQSALCALVLLEAEEKELMQCSVFPEEPSETLRWLAEHRFLVPAEHDDHSFCRDVREAARLVRRLTVEDGCEGFTILTTTACNARCFYCFEKGCAAEAMTKETAAAAANYILTEGNQKHVRLNWFGGEPTVNTRAIDQITEALTAAGRTYTSSMISNGYLLDEKLIEKAVGQWKLTNVQITLDGTEKIYNERKAYVGISGSAFQKVMNNIDLLLKAGIAVQIRLNVDTENVDDLSVLSDQLKERFGGRKKLSVYAVALFDNEDLSSSFDERLRASQRISRRLKELKLFGAAALGHFPVTFNCMADSGSGPVIMPDGGLRSCEHINASKDWGNVFQPAKRPEEETVFWNELYPEQPECRGCIAYPSCVRLKHCVPRPAICTEAMREDACRKLADSLLSTWKRIKDYRQGQQAEENPPQPC